MKNLIKRLFQNTKKTNKNGLLNELEQLADAAEYDMMKYKLTSDALGIALWDMDVVSGDPVNPNNRFTWSQEFRHMLGFTDENDFPNLTCSWSDRLHPEDKERTLDAFAAHLSDYTGQTPYDLEYRLMLKNGQYKYFRAFGTTLRGRKGIPIRVAGALQDIAEEKQITETIKHREKLLNALNEIDILLLSNNIDNFEAVLSDSLKPIADTASMDRIIFYCLTETGEGKEKHFGQVYRWDKNEGSLVSLDDDLIIVPNVPTTKNWIEILSKGEYINLQTGTMSGEEKEFLKTFGIKSILLTPFLINNELWGAVAFQDHTTERAFDADLIGFLSSAARLCNNAIIKNDKTKSARNALEELKRREKMMRTLNNAAIIFLSQADDSFDETMTAGIRTIVDMVRVDRFSLWCNSAQSDGLHASQIYRWDREASGTTIPTSGLEDVKYANLAPRWEDLFYSDESVNSPVGLLPEAAILQSFGVVSVYITPIFIGNKLWGFAMFEDRHNERYFDDESVEMMRSAAFLCADIVIMNEKTESAQNSMEALKRREKMMSALNKTAVMLLEDNTKNFNDVMSNSLVPVAAAGGIDRIAVYRLLDGKNQLGQIYLWYGKTLPLEDELVALPDISPIRRWLDVLTKGNCINVNLGKASQDEVDFLKQFGVKSVFMVPIFARGEFWGVVTLEDHTNYRDFHEDTHDLMRSTANLCAGAIVRAEMEKAIIKTQELMRDITEASPISYVLFDENMQVIDCNETMMNILGCTDKKYFLEHYWEKFVPKTQPDKEKSFDKAIAKRDEAFSGDQSRFEWIHYSLDGEAIPMENTLTRVTQNDKKMIVSFKYDLRNTKKMMDSIHKQSELLKIRLKQQEIISDISKGFISSGDSQLYVRDAIAKLGDYHKASSVFIYRIDYRHNKTVLEYNWSSKDEPPQPIDFDLHSMVIHSFPENLPECATLPVISCADTSKSDVYRDLLSVNINAFVSSPLYTEGRLWGVIAVVQRFVPRQWTENERKFVAITAGTIAGVIMRDIYNKTLKDALAKATSANKAKGEFLSNMSHEMRTPLNAIIGMTRIGKNSEQLDRKDYSLSKIEDASVHLLGVINDVLDISKIEANKFELSPVEFNFEKMLQRVVNVIHFRLDEKNQKLSVYIDKTIPKIINGDDQRIAQVITNLLSNAVKFTPDEGSITVNARFLGEDNGFCVIQVSVKDTGIGISPDQQKRLFQSFMQAESSTVRKYGGTGLGLAISKSIVEMMGGKIRVESEMGKGSSFIFTILVGRGEEKTQEIPPSNVNMNNARILVVDDDPFILEYISEIIHGFGGKCDTALSGKEALKMAKENQPYDIYFVDWKMPDMDGIELTEILKSQQTGTSENSVIIMISAAQWNDIEPEAKKAGVDKFLSKPLFPSSVADTINECFGIELQKKQTAQQTIDGIFKGHCILLVEDMEINREIILTVLEPTGLEMYCAENGAQAVKMYNEDPDKYEVIFMDVQMPEMDGFEATRRIREIEKELGKTSKRTPIIAMTANVFKEDIEKCISAGMNDHLGKPLDFDDVIEKIHTYLNRPGHI
ncbi:MAG: response regulator [Treponema sp.]|jgi:PAS domain S-box-containing protein|nr:response regulator [Treponema sp.]